MSTFSKEGGKRKKGKRVTTYPNWTYRSSGPDWAPAVCPRVLVTPARVETVGRLESAESPGGARGAAAAEAAESKEYNVCVMNQFRISQMNEISHQTDDFCALVVRMKSQGLHYHKSEWSIIPMEVLLIEAYGKPSSESSDDEEWPVNGFLVLVINQE
uniref:Uncharacterized protein n=1 Tax=Oryza punctata TaxID=4537 RepID=A0A0E0JIN5_ORYPU